MIESAMIDITEPVRLAAEALWAHVWPGGHTGEPYSREEDDRVTLTEDARVAVTAALPALAEIFAGILEDYADMDGDWVGPVDPDSIMRRAANLIRESV